MEKRLLRLSPDARHATSQPAVARGPRPALGNGGKARFFKLLGFSVDASESLIDALRAVAQTGEVVVGAESSHGEKYVVDGTVSSLTESHSRKVRTVWIIDRGLEAPRLVTAYPGKE